jgi:flagellar motor switch protein FliN
MTETETPKLLPIIEFLRVWTESFANVLAQLGAASPKVTFSEPAPAKALSSEELSVTTSVFFRGGGALHGDMVWVAQQPAALQCAQLLLSEPFDAAAELSDTRKDAFAELLRQVAAQVAASWKTVAGEETQISFQEAAGDVFVPAQSSSVTLSAEKVPEIALRFFVNSALFDVLSIRTPKAPEASTFTMETVPHAQREIADAGGPIGAVSPNLELLLDVELEAFIRFGEREMLLRDVFGLMPGAVVELNQLVNEPASLLVAGRTVARGEVVVVDGNFGLRVTEVASRGQRAELLQS